MNHRILTILTFVSLPAIAWMAGCGSSNGNAGSSSGTGGANRAGASDGGSQKTSDAAASGSTGNGGTAAPDSGGACTPPTSVPGSDVPAYVAVKQHLNACTTTQINDFLTACIGSTGSPNACQGWTGGSGNANCLSCLDATDGSGALLLDSSGNPLTLNEPGCIALRDTAGGSACAKALEPEIQCASSACSSCADQESYQRCTNQANGSGGACSSYVDSVKSGCESDFADGGAGATSGVCSNPTEVINVICGTGM